MDNKLGTLKDVSIESVWPGEATDFTPWLAQEENITKLSDAIGIELEVQQTEVAVGPYFADILARETGTGDSVVIENQYKKTNHDHLGKLITYAAVLEASAVVWIASEFTEQHRRAVDWLNENGSGDVSFFGVRVEVWQIDDSRPAVRFNVVARPEPAAIAARAAVSVGELSDARKLQFDWWTAFRQALLESKVASSVRAPSGQYWYIVPLGRRGIHLSNIANISDNRIGVRVYLTHRLGGDAALAQLLQQKQEIEKEIGQRLQWNPNPENRDKIIVIYREADLSRKDKWPEYLEWMVDMTRRFRAAFSPRIRHIDLNGGDSELAEGEGSRQN
jgi:Domain of unknown function (DUF4268)